MKLDRFSPVKSGQSTSIWSTCALIMLATLMLMWPTVLNRGPFFFSDTTAYIRGLDAAAYRGLGIDTDWTERFLQRYEAPHVESQSTNGPPASHAVTLAGRSIYYGAFLYGADRIGGLALVPVLQSLLLAICLYLTARRFGGGRRDVATTFLGLTFLLSLASSVGFFTGFLMPDLFSGIAILAAAHLLTRLPRLNARETAFWFTLLSWSALSHSSNLLILMVVAVAMLISKIKFGTPEARSIGFVAGAIVVGIVGELVFYGGVKAATGDAPVRPPFIMARIIADGPGKAFLQEHCSEDDFVLCRHMEGLSSNSDLILWGSTPQDGVFSAVDYAERRRIAGEELRFVSAVFADRPLAVLRSSAAAIADQIGKWRLSEFNSTPPETRELDAKLPARVQRQYAATRAYHGRMPLHVTEWLALIAALASVAVILTSLIRRTLPSSVKVFLATLLIGITADLAICGALSTPHDRYSTRVLWTLIVGAFVASAQTRWFAPGPRDQLESELGLNETQAT